MCFFSNEEYARNVKGAFTEREIERLAAMFFPKALLVVVGCGTEPTLYKSFTEIVQLAKDYKVPHVGFTTNGQLLKESHLEHFVRAELDELTISVHGVERSTYETFMAKASYDRLHEVLTTLDKIKTRLSSSFPRLRINYTVNPSNLGELHRFYDTYGQYNIHTLQVRPIIDFQGQFRELLRPTDVSEYSRIITGLHAESKARNIILLANTTDPTYNSEDYSSVILQAVHRRITPMEVWRPDFNWREETYTEFCKRIGWERYLLRAIVSGVEEVAEFNTGTWGKHSARYDINL
jgi:GTP 3',8-cyclase